MREREKEEKFFFSFTFVIQQKLKDAISFLF